MCNAAFLCNAACAGPAAGDVLCPSLEALTSPPGAGVRRGAASGARSRSWRGRSSASPTVTAFHVSAPLAGWARRFRIHCGGLGDNTPWAFDSVSVGQTRTWRCCTGPKRLAGSSRRSCGASGCPLTCTASPSGGARRPLRFIPPCRVA